MVQQLRLKKVMFYLFNTNEIKGGNMNDIIIVTSNEVSGYYTVETLGAVFGVNTRSRNKFSTVEQNFKAVIGGKISDYTKLQQNSCEQSIERMKEEAILKGANAIISMGFDSYSFENIDSVVAYGTAVKIEKIYEG